MRDVDPQGLAAGQTGHKAEDIPVIRKPDLENHNKVYLDVF